MPPRLTESLSVFRSRPPRHRRPRHRRPRHRRPSRLTFGVAAAIVATAAITATAVAGIAFNAPAPAGRSLDSAAAAGLPSGQRVSQPAKAAPAKAQSASAVHAAQPHPAPPPARTKAAGKARPQAASKPRRATTAHSQPAAKRQHAPARQQQPYEFYDSTTPAAIPAKQPAAVYSDGPYYTTPAQVGQLGSTLWIDVTGLNYSASVVDVEPSDATPSQAGTWVQHRLQANHEAIARVYTSLSEWPAVKAAIATLPSWMQARVHWWIADPTGVPHMVQGADATQWYWGSTYDMSLAMPGF